MDTKPTVLLAMALFLVSAPDPDSRAVAEMTANFIVPADEFALQAAELGDRREQTSMELEQDEDADATEADIESVSATQAAG